VKPIETWRAVKETEMFTRTKAITALRRPADFFGQGKHALVRAFVVVALIFNPATGRAQTQASWAPSWTAAQSRLDTDARLADEQLTDATLRQSVRLSMGGSRIRIVISNIAGLRPLTFAGVNVALTGVAGSAAIDSRSDREVSFAGRRSVIVPAGETATSDAVDLTVPALARLSVSMYFVASPAQQTGHLRSLSTSWLAHGDQLAAATFRAAVSVDHWYQLAAVQVEAFSPHVVVAIGDSITDGSRSIPNANNRWPDFLAERLQASPSTRHWAVANAGIAGNQLLAEGFGPSALARFDRDVLSQPHVHTVILLEGSNDLGQLGKKTPASDARRALFTQIVEAYQQLILRAHARGLRIIGATLTPYLGSDYEPTALDENSRQAINAWIRTPGHFDAVIDWDSVLRDPGDPGRLNPEFDSGDHIHPSSAGYRAMAYAVSISELVK
jgi:lysophospholipase L1-like esterase